MSHHYPQYMPPQPDSPYAGNLMKNGLGTGALILGILTLVFSWVPFLGIGSYVTGGVGIALALFGLKRVRHRAASNYGVTVSGLITSAVGIVSVLLATVAYSALLYGASEEAATGGEPKSQVAATDQPSSEPTTHVTDPSPEPASGIGDKVRDGRFQFTVLNVKDGVDTVGQDYLQEQAQGQFIVVKVRVKNVGDEPQTFFTDNQVLYGQGGKKYSADSAATISAGDEWIEEINPGNAIKGKVIFDVPEKFDAQRVELHDSAFSTGATVSLS